MITLIACSLNRLFTELGLEIEVKGSRGHSHWPACNKGNYLFPFFNEIDSGALSRLLSTNGMCRTPKQDQGRIQ